MKSIRLKDGKVIAEKGIPYIIAEVNSSHNGNPEVAKQMIDMAVDAGCDCVKFQSWSVESLYSKTYYDANPISKRFVKKFALSADVLKEMADYCADKGIAFSSTPYSISEVDFLVDVCKAPFIKISSMEVNNPEFLKYIACKGIPVIISTGMSDYEEVREAIEVIKSAGNQDIIILHCVSLYPTPIENVNLNNMITLSDMFPDCLIGFSDHTIGDECAVAATVMGATVLEKHITLDSQKIGMDNQMAMEPNEFIEYVRKCKNIKGAQGSKERVLLAEEIKQRETMRRSIVLTRNMKAGEIISKADIDVKRPGTGISPKDIDKVIGRRLNRDIESDSIVFENDLQ